MLTFYTAIIPNKKMHISIGSNNKLKYDNTVKAFAGVSFSSKYVYKENMAMHKTNPVILVKAELSALT